MIVPLPSSFLLSKLVALQHWKISVVAFSTHHMSIVQLYWETCCKFTCCFSGHVTLNQTSKGGYAINLVLHGHASFCLWFQHIVKSVLIPDYWHKISGDATRNLVCFAVYKMSCNIYTTWNVQAMSSKMYKVYKRLLSANCTRHCKHLLLSSCHYEWRIVIL